MSTQSDRSGSPADRARLAGWLDLAARGWHLFPVLPGRKQPAIPAWESRATTHPETIVDYFTAHPDHNAGIACGPSRLLVVDCDIPKPTDPDQSRDGAAVLAGQTDQHRLVRTPPGEVVARTMDADRLARYTDRWVDFVNGLLVALVTALIAQTWVCLLYTSPSPRDS